jgi:hypothetical protein
VIGSKPPPACMHPPTQRWVAERSPGRAISGYQIISRTIVRRLRGTDSFLLTCALPAAAVLAFELPLAHRCSVVS